MARSKKKLPICDVCKKEVEGTLPAVFGKDFKYYSDLRQCFHCLAMKTEESKKLYNMQTKSINFKDHEIKGISYENGKKVIHLKEGVRRKKYNDHLNDDEMHHINEQVILLEKINKFYLATGTTPIADNTED